MIRIFSWIDEESWLYKKFFRAPAAPFVETGRTRPLTEGYVVKGGQNGPSQIRTRPGPPSPMRYGGVRRRGRRMLKQGSET